MASHVFTPATGLVIRGKTRVSTMTPPGSPLGGAQRFPSRQRLRNRREFDAVFRQPSVRLRRGPLRLVARPNALGTARLGIVVAKRMIRRAVGRNRAKRVIRESFRLATGLPSMDIVVRVAQSEPAVCAPDADWLFAALARRAR